MVDYANIRVMITKMLVAADPFDDALLGCGPTDDHSFWRTRSDYATDS